MARTRASKPKAASDESALAAEQSTFIHTLPPQIPNPPQAFILPRAATAAAKIVTLPNPRHAKPTRYLVCPETGVYEFTKVSAPAATPRSWFFEIKEPSGGEDEESAADKPQKINGYISKSADLFVATQFDPLFLVLPALLEAAPKADAKRLFLASDDHFDKLPEESSHLNELLRDEKTRALFEARMKAVCDTVEAGSETMFRINEEKLFQVILGKAKKFAEGSLPKSMEEKFVIKPLQAPMVVRVRRDAPTADSGTSTPSTESVDSQASTATTESNGSSVASQASTAATSVAEDPDAVTEDAVTTAMQASPQVLALQRLRVAFNFICASYIPVALTTRLKQQLGDKGLCGTDFLPLETYLAELAKVRAEAIAARGGNHGRKHAREEEEDLAQQEKKRKLEEEKKKKAMESRGVRELRKVDTSGMMKLSAFFKKK
ncbi:hypothetical protein jhhlp_003324 [Lomentospora prolificans]|uniref:Ribonuclease H2 subunit B n=1 Tax=Lomentospora prolificans TaxID=41688 RepID=A0A2N3NGH6_9PEZI|nr:hypothetical protein jhhlp_003324 [Lomentospora prolificans]